MGQAIVFCVLALLILAGGPDWLRWVAGVLSAGALVAFALSRTVGLFGFAELGWNPSPLAAVSVIAEVLTVVFVAALCAEQPHQCPITLTAVTPGRGCDDGTIVRSHAASISFTDAPESLPLKACVR